MSFEAGRVAVVVAILSAVLSLWNVFNTDRKVSAALRLREEEFIQTMWPEIRDAYNDFAPGEEVLDSRPETIEGVIRPFLKPLQLGPR